MPPAVHPYSIFNLIWKCSSSRLALGITDFGLTFGVQKSQILRLQISLRCMGKEIFIIKKSHCIELYWIQNSTSTSYLLALSVLILVNLRNRTGKPRVTSVTIWFEKTFRQTSNRSFCRRSKNINVKWIPNKTRK